MFKVVAQMKHVVDGKEGVFTLDNDTSFPAAKEMCFSFLKHLGQAEDAALAQKKALEEQQQSEKPVEPVVESCAADCAH